MGSVLTMSVIILVVLGLNEGATGWQAILAEIEKQLVQLILVTVIGGIVGFLFKFYLSAKADLDRQREVEKMRHQGMIEFQSEQIRRLIEVTNRLRRAPALIEAHCSAKPTVNKCEVRLMRVWNCTGFNTKLICLDLLDLMTRM